MDYPFPVVDPFQLPEQFRALRAGEPVRKVRVRTGDEVWLVTRYADVRAVLSDRRFSRNIFREDAARLIPGVPTRQVSSPFVDPPAHTRWRKLVTRAFTPRFVEDLRPAVQKIVDQLLDAAEVAPRPVDLMPALAYPLSIRTLCEVLGVEPERIDEFCVLADTALTINTASMAAKGAAFAQMDAFSRRLIEAKRSQPGADFLSQLVGVIDSEDGRLSADELVATILAMLVGGYESATNQIGKTLLALFRYPEQLAALRADPSLVTSVVEEGLRFAALDSGFGSPRYALEDVPVGDAVIPKGSTVLVIRQSADRDTEQWGADADRFDITRDARQHTGFGHGPHRCLGSALARLEIELGVSTILRRFPGLRLTVPAEQVEWDYRITAAGPKSLPVTW